MNQKERPAPFVRGREGRAARDVDWRTEPQAQPPVLDMGGQGTALCFAHANGYPPESYRPLFDVLGSRFHIGADERYRWYLSSLRALNERFTQSDPGGQIAALRELEHLSYKEMRRFIVAHKRARFLL